MKTASRPPLQTVPLASVFPPRRGMAYITCSPGQWDGVLRAAYEVGFVLIEVDAAERPVQAYQRQEAEVN